MTPAARRRIASFALAALVAGTGLALVHWLPPLPPDAAYVARVRAWSDMPPAVHPGQR